MKRVQEIFKGLQHGDPQAVAITSVLAFLAAVGWFVWSIYLSDPQPSTTMSGNRELRRAPTPTPLSPLITEQQRIKVPADAPNPFFWEYLLPTPTPEPRATKPPRPKRTPKPRATRKPSGPKATKSPKLPADPVATKVAMVSYSFAGTLRRPDGSTVALLRNASEGTRRFLQIGDEAGPLTVTEINTKMITCTHLDGSEVVIVRGETVTIEAQPSPETKP